MRLAFATREGYLPHVIGGGVLGIHHLCHGCIRAGHASEVLCSIASKPARLTLGVLRRLLGMSASFSDAGNGYRTRRALPSTVKALLQKMEADVVITQGEGRGELAEFAANKGIPAIIRAVTAECVECVAREACKRGSLRRLLECGAIKVIGPSAFISRRVESILGVASDFIYELVRLEPRIRQEDRLITFVNPVPVKGLEIALEVARLLPQRRFLFAESWALSSEARRDLVRQLPANVMFRQRSLTMRDVYEKTAVLLMPSQCEEAFGRVILEAAASGIPSVASNIGGIPEAAGGGAILLPPTSSPAEWAAAVENLIASASLYGDLCDKALENSRRPEFQEEYIIKKLLTIASQGQIHRKEHFAASLRSMRRCDSIS